MQNAGPANEYLPDERAICMYYPNCHWIVRVTGENISQIKWIVNTIWPYRQKNKSAGK